MPAWSRRTGMEEEAFDKFDEPDNHELKLYIRALERQTLESIERFFNGRTWFCGGPIPKNYLYSKQSVDLVLSTEFLAGVDEVRALLPREHPPKGFDPKRLDWDTHRLLKLLHEVKRFDIPKEFQCGMILLFMKFCMGIKLPEKKRNLTHIIS
jgi:hypothetical protein